MYEMREREGGKRGTGNAKFAQLGYVWSGCVH